VRLPWLAHDEALGPYITIILQYQFNKTKQHTHYKKEKMIVIFNSFKSQVASQAVAEEGGEVRGGGRWEKRLPLGVDGAKSKIKVQSRRGHEWSAEDFSDSVREITVSSIVIIVTVSRHSTHVDIFMSDCNVDICACIGLLMDRERVY